MKLQTLIEQTSELVYQNLLSEGFTKKDIMDWNWSVLVDRHIKSDIKELHKRLNDNEWIEPYKLGGLIQKNLLLKFN